MFSKEYYAKIGVDVLIPTFNSNKLGFTKALKSVAREVPVHHLIVVDRFSTDGTVEVVRRFFPDAIIIESEARLAPALKEGIDRVDTEFFVSIDDDDELGPNWFAAVMECFRFERVGGAYVKNETGFRDGIYPIVNFHRWGAIRTSAVRDWSPPNWLSGGSDEHLGRHIQRKGYRTLMTTRGKITSHPPDLAFPFEISAWYFKKGLWEGAAEKSVDVPLRSIILGGALQFASNLRRRRMRTDFDLVDSTASFIGSVLGYYTWRKHIHWSRPVSRSTDTHNEYKGH